MDLTVCIMNEAINTTTLTPSEVFLGSRQGQLFMGFACCIGILLFVSIDLCLLIHVVLVCLQGFYILATSKLISGWVPTCDIPYSVAQLGNQVVADTMTWFWTQSHYPDTELAGPWFILVIQSARLGCDKYRFCKSFVWLGQLSNSWPSVMEACTLPIQTPRLYTCLSILSFTTKVIRVYFVRFVCAIVCESSVRGWPFRPSYAKWYFT